jgi:hypothetical protein
MALHHGDMEKYLGAKYAQQLADNRELHQTYEEARDVLYGSMDVLSMFNKVNIAMRQIRAIRN